MSEPVVFNIADVVQCNHARWVVRHVRRDADERQLLCLSNVGMYLTNIKASRCQLLHRGGTTGCEPMELAAGVEAIGNERRRRARLRGEESETASGGAGRPMSVGISTITMTAAPGWRIRGRLHRLPAPSLPRWLRRTGVPWC